MMEATFVAGAVTFFAAGAGALFGLVLARGGKRERQAQVSAAVALASETQVSLAAVDRLEHVLEKPLALQPLPPLEVRIPEPDWHKKQLAVRASVEPQPELERLTLELGRTNTLFDDFLARQPEVDKRIEGLARLLAEGMRPLEDLPGVLSRLMTQTGSNVTIAQPPMLLVGGGGDGGGGGAPPRRPAPRAVPRANPGPPAPTPSIPAGYVGGSVIVPPGEPVSLLALIQQQLTPNCPGSSMELLLEADDSILVGCASTIAGPLSETNFAYELLPGGPPRVYRSSFPGHCTPLGDLQVFATAGGVLHVEVS